MQDVLVCQCIRRYKFWNEVGINTKHQSATHMRKKCRTHTIRNSAWAYTIKCKHWHNQGWGSHGSCPSPKMGQPNKFISWVSNLCCRWSLVQPTLPRPKPPVDTTYPHPTARSVPSAPHA